MHFDQSNAGCFSIKSEPDEMEKKYKKAGRYALPFHGKELCSGLPKTPVDKPQAGDDQTKNGDDGSSSGTRIS